MVFVNDGSTDRTQDLLEAARQKFSGVRIGLVGYSPNRGKGYAVRAGVLQAQGDKILVMDSDFSIELSEMSKFVDALNDVDVAIGTKNIN